MKRNLCETCLAYCPIESETNLGECRIDAPAAGSDIIDTPGAVWPLTRPGRWCLQYIAIPEGMK